VSTTLSGFSAIVCGGGKRRVDMTPLTEGSFYRARVRPAMGAGARGVTSWLLAGRNELLDSDAFEGEEQFLFC
jgi:hypothetical protein